MKIRKAIFDSPIQNEVELELQSKELLKKLSNPPTKAELLNISKTHSVDIATRCFFDGIKLSKHNKIIEEINTQPIKPKEINSDLLIYIIPGMFHKEHPELGTNGDLVKEIAQKFGLKTKFINTNSVGSIEENAKTVVEQLKKETHPNICLLSISKGSCNVRKILQTNPNIDNISAWIDLAGVHQGVPFIDKAFNAFFSRLYLRLISKVFRMQFSTFTELKTSSPHWKNNNWPNNINIIHIVPVPLQSHVHNSIIRRYKQTLIHGPNDGFIPLVDSLTLPGCIYPIWGYDHYLRNPNLSQLLHKLFNYLITTQPKKKYT